MFFGHGLLQNQWFLLPQILSVFYQLANFFEFFVVS